MDCYCHRTKNVIGLLLAMILLAGGVAYYFNAIGATGIFDFTNYYYCSNFFIYMYTFVNFLKIRILELDDIGETRRGNVLSVT